MPNAPRSVVGLSRLQAFLLLRLNSVPSHLLGLRLLQVSRAALTNNPVVAMQWIGDTDLSMAKRYLKKRDED